MLAALSLYCQIPFGRIYSTNPDVIATANRVGRTSSAVALKLANFASLDPDHQSRGVRGMQNASALDRKVWDRYYGRWEDLSLATLASDERSEAEVGIETSREATVLVRRGQSFFRKAVLAAYDGTCCITGIALPELIRASHIVPWSHRENSRLDPRNGVALNALHDAALDRGLMTLSDKCEVILSRRLRDQIQEQAVYEQYFAQYEGIVISLPERFMPSKECLEYHREQIFAA